jgi:hypothetical protein
MLLLNRFLPYSHSWHGAVNSDIKHSMHCMGVHDVAVHDVAVHDVAVHDVAVHDVAVHDMALHDVAMHDMAMLRGHVLCEHAQHGRAWR